MNPRIKKLLGCAAIAALLAAGPNLNAKEGEMPKKMMMYYGGFEIEEMFDASQWFARGMYRTRNIEADGGASNVTMLRSFAQRGNMPCMQDIKATICKNNCFCFQSPLCQTFLKFRQRQYFVLYTVARSQFSCFYCDEIIKQRR